VAHVTLVDYEAAWPGHFHLLASQLEALFAPGSVRFEHIGSTSVVGLCAKPVIDLMLGVSELAVVDSRVAAIGLLGYEYRQKYEAQLPQRRYFVRPPSSIPRVHLHALVLDGPIWRQHLAFRDELRASPKLLAEYASLKRSLVAQHANDKAEYTAAKAPFIESVLASKQLSTHTARREA
jgi:GrpB-like predicted nucleotidyltransferase (UPF0157 family)